MLENVQQYKLRGKVVFIKAEIKPPFKIEASMEDEVCFYYVTHGKTNIHSPSGSIRVTDSSGVLLNCGRYVNEYLPEGNNDSCQAIGIHLYPSVIQSIYNDILPDFLTKKPDGITAEFNFIGTDKMIGKYIESLQYYFKNPSLINDELLELKIKELLLLLVKTDRIKIIQKLFLGPQRKRNIEFKNTISTHVLSNLTINELAFLNHMSVSSFKRKFKNLYRTTPAKYMREAKLKKSAELLKHSEHSITSISIELGYKDVASFSAAFKSHFQCSPSQYRNS